jgi:hypothetical protein
MPASGSGGHEIGTPRIVVTSGHSTDDFHLALEDLTDCDHDGSVLWPPNPPRIPDLTNSAEMLCFPYKILRRAENFSPRRKSPQEHLLSKEISVNYATIGARCQGKVGSSGYPLGKMNGHDANGFGHFLVTTKL